MPPFHLYIDFTSLCKSQTRDGMLIMHPSEATGNDFEYTPKKLYLDI